MSTFKIRDFPLNVGILKFKILKLKQCHALKCEFELILEASTECSECKYELTFTFLIWAS